MDPLAGKNYLSTPDGLNQIQTILAQQSELGASTLLTADGRTIAVEITPRPVASLYRIRVCHREIVDSGDRLVLTEGGWKRIDELKVMDQVIVRCGTRDPLLSVDAGGQTVRLGEKHSPRIVELVELVSPSSNGDRNSTESPFTVYDIRKDGEAEAFEIGGIVAQTVSSQE
jgi:hypothetical protein